MLILIGCEESQEVAKAFRALGHEAYSCDLKPCSGGNPEYHLQMDIIQALHLKKWDMFIYFPDCTYICVSGLHWNKRISGRTQKTEDALQFVCRLWNMANMLGINYVGFENPIGCIPTRIVKDSNNNLIVVPLENAGKKLGKHGFKPSQIIQPYHFGEDASKATCLWLKNLPLLQNTEYIKPRLVCPCGAVHAYGYLENACNKCGRETGLFKPRWSNQTDSGQNKLAPSDMRAELRSKTYPGIAQAMAKTWG